MSMLLYEYDAWDPGQPGLVFNGKVGDPGGGGLEIYDSWGPFPPGPFCDNWWNAGWIILVWVIAAYGNTNPKEPSWRNTLKEIRTHKNKESEARDSIHAFIQNSTRKQLKIRIS